MFDNNTYNLLSQIVEEHQSLWRIKEYYKKDASGCSECLEFWNFLEKDKEEHIQKLEELLKKQIK
jgi:hypothetical protein